MCKCNQIFANFRWNDLATIRMEMLPKNAGVYAVRVRERGKPIEWIISCSHALLGEINWFHFEEYVVSRIRRLRNIGGCPLIYIGAAPTSLRGRYKDMCGERHTAFYPIVALLFAGWKLDFGWFEDGEPAKKERLLKKQYRKVHGALPALVQR